MAIWEVSPTYKKSITERQYWTKDGETIVYEIGWRWGKFEVITETDDPPDIYEGIDIFSLPEGCELGEWETDDGWWEDKDFSELSEETTLIVEEFLEENSIYDLEGEGWVMEECEMLIECPAEVKRIEA